MPFDRNLRHQFLTKGKEYDRYRPHHQDEVIEKIIEFSGIKPNDRILDIGCGPGRATIKFAKKGFYIVGVDPSKELIDIAQKKSKGLPIRYINSGFEEAEIKGKFELITAAQSLHWIKPEGYKKIHQLLEGTLAAFWNFEDMEATEQFQKIKRLFRKYCPKLPSDYGESERYKANIAKTGLFQKCTEQRHHWKREMTKKDFFGYLKTLSWISSLKQPEKLFEKLEKIVGENITIPYYTILLMTKKIKH